MTDLHARVLTAVRKLIFPLSLVALLYTGHAPYPAPPTPSKPPPRALTGVAEAAEPVEAKGEAPSPAVVPFKNTSKARSPHVRRGWQLIGGVGVNTVHVDIKAPTVRLLVGFADNADPKRGYFPRQNFYRIVEHYKPRVAINGTYFNLRNGQPTGSIIRYGQFLYDGRWGTALCIDREGKVTFRHRSGTYGRDMGWGDTVYHAFTSGPTLVSHGEVWLNPRQEGFRDPRVLGKARRSAIGQTNSGKLVLVTVHTHISLNKLANIMVKLGCEDAVALDGGSSSALYSNGEYVTIPHRKLSNVLLVYD